MKTITGAELETGKWYSALNDFYPKEDFFFKYLKYEDGKIWYTIKCGNGWHLSDNANYKTILDYFNNETMLKTIEDLDLSLLAQYLPENHPELKLQETNMFPIY